MPVTKYEAENKQVVRVKARTGNISKKYSVLHVGKDCDIEFGVGR